MSRASSREVGVGLLVLVAITGLGGLLVVSGGGPGFLTPRRSIDVVFRDGQGLRVGSPVRVAGIDSGRVDHIDLAEVEGTLRARVRISIPASLATKLRQDVKVAVQSGLTGQCVVNIVSSGRSSVALVRGQLVMGVESSFFDPVLQQVGLGPEERSHLSHTIAEVRQTVDAAGPKLRRALGALQEAAVALQETVEQTKPKVVATAGHVEEMVGRLDDAKVEELIKTLRGVLTQTEALVRQTGPKLGATLTNVAELSATVSALAKDEKPKVDALLVGLNGTRVKADRVLANAESMTGTGASILAKNRGDIERVMANARDASDFGVKLVQKLVANPFYLSPFYKPTAADLKAQEVYDSANVFMNGAKELDDAIKSLQAMQTRPMTEQDRKAYQLLFGEAWELKNKLKVTQQRLAEQLNTPTRR
ncbi:MAG: ABC-type transport system involved in resistance to organic solvent, periplasmic component [Planctomycetota bacterium]|nr:ABC-type transport system involved in resistance to organic solvent, periplasmic component [Planctomycetota bacterium]